jgi:hypothetical protein
MADATRKFLHVIQMLVSTTIHLRERFPLWHGSFHSTLGKGGTLMIGHGITRDLIGHPVLDNATAGANILDVAAYGVDHLSGTILFRNL